MVIENFYLLYLIPGRTFILRHTYIPAFYRIPLYCMGRDFSIWRHRESHCFTISSELKGLQVAIRGKRRGARRRI
jgi:hypothetical protein